MMRRSTILLALLLLPACGAPPSGETQALDVAEPAPAKPGVAGAAPLQAAAPQIAYEYAYAFRLPHDRVKAAQAAHVALCDRLGPQRCQLIAMEQASDADDASGSLKLRVASSIARAFGTQLSDAVASAGGTTSTSSIAAEDVSKAIVDTEARLAQRTLLVERLTEILRTRKGTVAELVEAERGVAAAQEEIDQARAWLTTLRGRVAMSAIDIRYDAASATGLAVGGGVGAAVIDSAETFVTGLAMLLRLAIYLLPWALLAGGIVWTIRRLAKGRLPLWNRRSEE